MAESRRRTNRETLEFVPEIGETLQPRSRAAWRAWLARNHAGKTEIWLILYKKHARRAGLTYEQAVEEALCFGWIDGVLKRLDDEKHVLRFSPRRPNSVWSDPNKRRVRRLTQAGRMTEAGLRAVRVGKRRGTWQAGSGPAVHDPAPPELQAALSRHRAAREQFERLTAAQRRQYVAWILLAKRPETRARRVRAAVERLAQGKRSGVG